MEYRGGKTEEGFGGKKTRIIFLQVRTLPHFGRWGRRKKKEKKKPGWEWLYAIGYRENNPTERKGRQRYPAISSYHNKKITNNL
jgi:hypothetical protein